MDRTYRMDSDIHSMPPLPRTCCYRWCALSLDELQVLFSPVGMPLECP